MAFARKVPTPIDGRKLHARLVLRGNRLPGQLLDCFLGPAERNRSDQRLHPPTKNIDSQPPS